MMPVYLLHAPVLIVCGWAARALHCHDRLTTPAAGIVLWLAAVLISAHLGKSLRRHTPILLGHR